MREALCVSQSAGGEEGGREGRAVPFRERRLDLQSNSSYTRSFFSLRFATYAFLRPRDVATPIPARAAQSGSPIDGQKGNLRAPELPEGVVRRTDVQEKTENDSRGALGHPLKTKHTAPVGTAALAEN